MCTNSIAKSYGKLPVLSEQTICREMHNLLSLTRAIKATFYITISDSYQVISLDLRTTELWLYSTESCWSPEHQDWGTLASSRCASCPCTALSWTPPLHSLQQENKFCDRFGVTRVMTECPGYSHWLHSQLLTLKIHAQVSFPDTDLSPRTITIQVTSGKSALKYFCYPKKFLLSTLYPNNAHHRLTRSFNGAIFFW